MFLYIPRHIPLFCCLFWVPRERLIDVTVSDSRGESAQYLLDRAGEVWRMYVRLRLAIALVRATRVIDQHRLAPRGPPGPDVSVGVSHHPSHVQIQPPGAGDIQQHPRCGLTASAR